MNYMSNSQHLSIEGADWEDTIDFDKLRKDRAENVRKSMRKHDVDAVFVLKPENVRYICGGRGVQPEFWFADYCLFPVEDEPIYYALGGDLERSKSTMSWMKSRIRPAISIEHVVPNRDELSRKVVTEILNELKGIKKSTFKVAVDVLNYPLVAAFENAGIEICDGEKVMVDSRTVKTIEEVALIRRACRINDIAMYHCFQTMKPGMSERQLSAELISVLRVLGSEGWQRGIVTSGENLVPFRRIVGGSDKLIMPSDLVLIDSHHMAMGYHSDQARTYVCGGHANENMKKAHKIAYDSLYSGIKMLKVGNKPRDVLSVWDDTSDWSSFTVNFGHGIGISGHDAPLITSHVKDEPTVFSPNMVINLETFATVQKYAVRLEEVVLITDSGPEVITSVPFDDQLM